MRKLPLFLLAMPMLPLDLAAQVAPAEPSRLSISAFTGARVPFTTGSVVLYDAEGAALFAAREQRGGNPVLGMEVKSDLGRGFSAVIGGVFTRAGNGEFFIDRDPGFNERGDYLVRYMSDTWFAKVGLGYRVSGAARVKDGRAMPSTDLVVGAAMLRQFQTSHPALNLGFSGSIPIPGTGFEAMVGIEDYFVFWDDQELTPIMLDILGPVRPGAVSADMFYDTSHLLMLRLGATVRI